MRFLFILLLLATSVSLFAQDDEAADDVVSVDPSATYSSQSYGKEDHELRKFDEKKWKKVIGDVNFEEKKPKPKKPASDDNQSGKNNFSGFSIDPATARLVGYIVVFILFAFILFYVARNLNLKSKSIKKMAPADVSAPVENIEELDTEDLLKQALASGDLRLAVRIQYLLLLKKLNEVGLIIWKKDKTNREYLSELYERTDCYNNVRDLTLAYELVWYGERSVSSDSFHRLSGEFETVNQRITKTAPGT